MLYHLKILFYVPGISYRRLCFFVLFIIFFAFLFPRTYLVTLLHQPIALLPSLSVCLSNLCWYYLQIIPSVSLTFFFFPYSHPIFFHFTPLLLLLPPLMSFHISFSSSDWLPSSLGLPFSLLHTPDALLLASVCPKGLIDSER